MKVIEQALENVTGYLFSITRDTINGWYDIEIGIPSKWTAFEGNDKISCEILSDNKDGKVIKISPKIEDIGIDDLILFIEAIININEKIAEKETEFTREMEEMKSMLEEKAKKFYKDLDEMKENSLKSITINNIVKPKKITNKQIVNNKTETNNKEIIESNI